MVVLISEDGHVLRKAFDFEVKGRNGRRNGYRIGRLRNNTWKFV